MITTTDVYKESTYTHTVVSLQANVACRSYSLFAENRVRNIFTCLVVVVVVSKELMSYGLAPVVI